MIGGYSGSLEVLLLELLLVQLGELLLLQLGELLLHERSCWMVMSD